MTNKLHTKITSRSNSEAIAQKLFALLITSVLSSAVFTTTTANAQTATSPSSSGAVGQKSSGGAWGVKNPLFDAVAGKINLTANLGYVFNFASNWDSNDIGTGNANGAVGYGARLGWTHKSGFGISGDYLGFTSKWSNGGMDYTNPYNILTITPSYRFSFGQNKEWGVKVGLGIGMSLADVSWSKDTQTAKGVNGGASRKVAGGAVYKDNNAIYSTTGSGASLQGAVTFANGTSPAITAGNNTACSFGVYADSKGQTSINPAHLGPLLGGGNDNSSVAPIAASRCAINATTNSTPSQTITDTQIATALKDGKISVLQAKSDAGVAKAVWTEVLGANATVAGVNALAAAENFESDTAVIMNANTWDALDYNTKTKLKTTLGLVANDITASPSSGGSAKDDAGFVLAPEVAVEYDNGLFHGDINLRYIHGLVNVKYDGQNTTANQLQKSGPLALFIGAGLGVNF
ncbi:MAG: hypothetical protein QM529_07560 [Hydrotalea sp.]|nr:hypothetical protein [Hydrotalea sp.]